MSDNEDHDLLNDDFVEAGDDTYNLDIEDEDLLLADDDHQEVTKLHPKIVPEKKIIQPKVLLNNSQSKIVIKPTPIETKPIVCTPKEVSSPNLAQNVSSPRKVSQPNPVQVSTLSEKEPILCSSAKDSQSNTVQKSIVCSPIKDSQPPAKKPIVCSPITDSQLKKPIVCTPANESPQNVVTQKKPIVCTPVKESPPNVVTLKRPIVCTPAENLPETAATPKKPIVCSPKYDSLQNEDQKEQVNSKTSIISPVKAVVVEPSQPKVVSSCDTPDFPSADTPKDKTSTEKTIVDSTDGDDTFHKDVSINDESNKVSSSVDAEDTKYRDECNERFPSERQSSPKFSQNIPDSLENVIISDKNKPNDSGKPFKNKNFHPDSRPFSQKGFNGPRDFGGPRDSFREGGRPYNDFPHRDFGPDYPPKYPYSRSRNEFDMPPKKVLINPHFKGPGFNGQDYATSQFSDGRSHGLDAFHTNVDPRSLGLDPYRGRRQFDVLNQGPVNEEALGKLAEQFINEQQRCLQSKMCPRDDDDFFEKTRRFIENTSIDTANRIDPETEMLREKQEQFIQSNIINLNRRRDPPPRALRSPPRRPRPPKSFRSRSPSPKPVTEETSADVDDGEDGEYKAKLKEQAEMRARILQAKERRRKRDAETLKQKLKELMEIEEAEEKSKAQEASKSQSTEKTNDVKSTHNDEVKMEEEKLLLHMDEFLEEDAIQLAPEDEDLLLTDPEEEEFVEKRKKKAPKIVILGSSSNEPTQPTVKPKPIVFDIDSKRESKPASKETKLIQTKSEKPNLKRPAEKNSQDLRSKIAKPAEIIANQVIQPRKKIIYTEDSNENEKQTKVERLISNTSAPRRRENIDQVPSIAARAISDVLQTATNNKRSVFSLKPKETSPLKNNEGNKAESDASTKSVFGGRRIVVNRTPSNRVVLPRKPQQPLVIIETEDDDPASESKDGSPEKMSRDDKSLKAIVNGLPPGMTEARLLSLCGPEVERVNIDGTTAEAHFNSGDACGRFVRRFNGKMVSAHTLKVRRA